MTIKVMIVDDSAVVRQVMLDTLSKASDIVVIGSAPDPIFAREKMEKDWPDVIVLDIEMPRMDGLTFLKKIMAERPTPVVICSSLTEKGAEITMQALSAGALAIITKPSLGVRDFIQDSSADLIHAIRAASMARLQRLRPAAAPQTHHSSPSAPPPSRTHSAPASSASIMQERMSSPKLSADAILQAAGSQSTIQTTQKIIAIGTSTGGTQALESILPELPKTSPGIVIVQHMPEKFTATFAARLNSLSQIEVREAKNNDRILPGLALIAPGGKHMLVKRNGTQYHVDVIDGPMVSRHRPSVDVLFRSVANAAGRNATGFILTGMGDDGARGIKELHDTGARTYAQDEASCVVFGMPKEAIKLEACDEVIALERIPDVIAKLSNR
ncbi:protein-glutamate methylesterase/protein-glutamine glutaminase [Iodobacter fluviatilis]|uniref:Protein-glutamate methylesterase/protein-glutamine glutaminase n=1 Tax=Iodobacter fluviatilis TaxID=537 RepID=A0A377Q811_9NEIS|nr:chemotaxis response regulator protein-glutamate methylesterase [Iodobacter fluviatilis]TCU89597.1 two-component system chemotaxis response regulator CheB [Iodobacter fluviatilis]STQ90967.1 Chemotaxis response regulator protein-glutamate methylesterase [Iodobacter fluviatilis]